MNLVFVLVLSGERVFCQDKMLMAKGSGSLGRHSQLAISREFATLLLAASPPCLRSWKSRKALLPGCHSCAILTPFVSSKRKFNLVILINSRAHCYSMRLSLHHISGRLGDSSLSHFTHRCSEWMIDASDSETVERSDSDRVALHHKEASMM